MLFNSFSFFVFFPLVTTLYFLFPHRARWALLLFASCVFYMWFIPEYILILAATIIVDYLAGIWIEESSTTQKKKFYFIFSIITTCLILFVFKYFNFFNYSVERLAHALGWNYHVEALQIILPIGLSFHTFQSLSYVIEVYRGHQKAERHFGIYSLYVMFYPQLVAGPIERPQNLLHQFYEKHDFDAERVADGLKLMIWGLFKKIVIADRLALFVNPVYDNPALHSGPILTIATVFFAFQIYCDFSGYSDIAIGSSQVMGFKLMDNFNRPYFSKSIAEFWKRWHISLSTWFRDYLYLSLGGNRCSKPRWWFNLFFTFLVSGLWHGANWTYIVWGGLNGFYLVFALWTKEARSSIEKAVGLHRPSLLRKAWKIGVTFGLICFSWIFFRARDMETAFTLIRGLRQGWSTSFLSSLTKTGFSTSQFILSWLLLAFLMFIHLIQRHGSIRHMLKDKPVWVRWSIYYLLVYGILLLGVFSKNEFIYFQF
ncbi:MAG: MBOAT family protein [Bdellovibrionales bacterium]